VSNEFKVLNVFPSPARPLSRTLSKLGLPSSAHDFLLVTLLTHMPISNLFYLSAISSIYSIFARVLAPGNSLNGRELIQSCTTVTSMSSGVQSSVSERPSYHRTSVLPSLLACVPTPRAPNSQSSPLYPCRNREEPSTLTLSSMDGRSTLLPLEHAV
jgi:hypothetical protein